MAINLDKFTITSYDQFTGFDRTTGALEMILDEMTDVTLSHEQEETDITGKGGRRISTLKKNKAVTVSGTNGMLSGGALATMIGGETPQETDTYKIRYTDAIVVTGNKAITTEKAVGTAGQEIGTVYIRNEANAYISGGKKLAQSDAVAEGKFTYDPETKELEFNEDEIADGTEIIVFYDAEVTGYSIINDADNYSKVLSGFLDVTCQDGCDNIFHGQFIFKRADFTGTFDLTGGSDPSTQNFEFKSLPDLCTGATQLWEFILFE